MEGANSFLGRGWAFPPSFDRGSMSVKMVSELEDIQESIRIILSTTPGERVMQPAFGCPLRRMVFERLDTAFMNELNDIIRQALLNFEPRIRFIEAVVIQENVLEGIVYIEIGFSVIITNTRHNLVYPFYFLEGTNISE
jgi:phage baseplate assembly protein W